MDRRDLSPAAECAVPATEKHGEGLCRPVRCDEIGYTVTIEIGDRHRPGVRSDSVSDPWQKCAVSPADEDRYGTRSTVCHDEVQPSVMIEICEVDCIPCTPRVEVLALCEGAILGGKKDRDRIREHSANDDIGTPIAVNVAYGHRPGVITNFKGAEGSEEPEV